MRKMPKSYHCSVPFICLYASLIRAPRVDLCQDPPMGMRQNRESNQRHAG